MRLPRIPSRDGRRALRRPRPYQLVLAVLALAAVGLGLGLTLGLRSPAGSQSPSTELAPLLREAGPLVVFSELGLEADTIWAAGPDNPSERAELARVQHAPGFGISPSLSPDGARIAYTAVAPNVVAAGPDAPAELWVLDIETGATTRLAEGVDLQITPVWSRGGDAVVARRSESPEDAEGSFELLRIDLSGAVTSLVGGSQGLFPIDFSPDGRALYYASISPSGTDLASVPA
ncbi:MAG: hypothetical protein U1B78_03915, partial [Dehalococcoidia bacterium]|nr:hypothetical protein [Dehalococcoidia bacterium]